MNSGFIWLVTILYLYVLVKSLILKSHIIENNHFSDFQSLEKTVLELNSIKSTPIKDVLTVYLNGIESLFPYMKCSIQKVKNNGLFNWSSPSLPARYVQHLENIPIGDNAGSCGTAAYLKKKVIVSDIAHDPRWSGYKELALSYGLRACWSHPIIDSGGMVMATFAIYYYEIKTPDLEEIEVIDRSVAILKVILENRQNSEIIQESNLLMAQGQELAHFGSWQWDIQDNVVTLSDTLYSIYGLNKNYFSVTYESYLDLLYKDDKERVHAHIQTALHTKNDTEYEERIVRPSGELRYLKSWGKVIQNEMGEPVKMVGACLDITESKMIQDELQKSESRLRSLANIQTNYVIRTDLAGNYKYYNNKYAEDFGWISDNDNLIGVNSLITVLPHHHELVRNVVKNCHENPDKMYSVELDKVQKEGGVISILWHFICITDSSGSPWEMQCTGIDVTEQKQAENALKISNERYEYVNKATHDAIYDWDGRKDHIEWGEGFYRLFGYEKSKENFPMTEWLSKVHPADVNKMREVLKNTLADNTQIHLMLDYQFLKANGTYAFVEENAYIIRNAAGEAIRMIGVVRDVTKQKQEEDHLKLLESVVTHTNDSVLIAQSDPNDSTGLKILYVNHALIALTGYTPDELVGKSPFILFGRDFDTSMFNSAMESLRELKPRSIETAIYKKNGEVIWIDLSLGPVVNYKSLLTNWICIAHDISDRMNYTKAIEKQNKNLQEIAWMQSHVVRAPLARLMGLIDLINNYPNSDSEKKELHNYLLHSAHELDAIIRNISEKTKLI